MIIAKEFKFEASHILPKHPGKCSRLHGHSWVLKVEVAGQVDKETGFVMDYAEISEIVKPLIARLDHRHLGAWTHLFHKPMSERYLDSVVEGMPDDFYPSSENLLVWIGGELLAAGLNWSTLRLNETCTSEAILPRFEYRDAKADEQLP